MKHVFNNENIPPSLINTEAGKEYYRGLKQQIPKPLQNKSSTPKHLQLIPSSTNLVPKSKNVNSSIKNLKKQLNLPSRVTLPELKELMRTKYRTNTNEHTEIAQLLILLLKLIQKTKKGIKTTNMGPQELLLLENRPHSNINLPKSVPRAKNSFRNLYEQGKRNLQRPHKNINLTKTASKEEIIKKQQIFKEFSEVLEIEKVDKLRKQLNSIAELGETEKINNKDLEEVINISEKNNKTGQGWSLGKIGLRSVTIIGIA